MKSVSRAKQEYNENLLLNLKKTIVGSGGSRISRRGRRAPVRGGMDLRHVHFLVKMYVKTKELGPIWGAYAGHALPRSANGWHKYQ